MDRAGHVVVAQEPPGSLFDPTLPQMLPAGYLGSVGLVSETSPPDELPVGGREDVSKAAVDVDPVHEGRAFHDDFVATQVDLLVIDEHYVRQ